MTLPAITPRWMLHAYGRNGSRPHMTGDAVAAHLKIMGYGRRRSGQRDASQTGRRHAHPVVFDKQPGLGHGDMTLPAGHLFGVRRNGRILFQFFRPAAPGVTGQTLDRGQIRLFDFMRDKRR